MVTTIPVIPIPLSVEEGTGTSVPVSHVQGRPRVPVDILQEIFPHLQFKDRLNISLLSKDISAALPPRHIHVVLDTVHQLTSFSAYISRDFSRASALRLLHILVDCPFPSEKQSELQDAQHNVSLILENAINLEELVCRGDAVCDLLPKTLTTSRRLSHVELQGLPPALTGEELNEDFFPFTLQSIHITRWHPHIVRCLPLVWILRQLSHLPSLRTLTIEHHVFSIFMLRVDEQSAAAALPVLPSIHTLKLVGYYARGVVHPKFVLKLAQSLPNLTTLHLDCTSLPGGSPEYTVDHLILTNIPWWLKQDLTPWKVRRLTYVLEPDSGRSDFSLAHGRVDLSTALCLSISQPVIAAQIWDDMAAHAEDVRLFELESSATRFSELVAPLIERRHGPTESLAHVPLAYISISTRELGISWDSDGSWEQARNDFLRGASSCFPSLRYVAVATPHRPARTRIAPAPAYPGDDIPVWTWWRVHRDSRGLVVEIKEIPVWEGRRVREFLRDADAKTVDNIDRFFGSKGAFAPLW